MLKTLKRLLTPNSSMAWVREILNQHKISIFLLTILQSISAILGTLYPLITLQVLNAVEQRNKAAFLLALGLFVSFILIQMLLWYIMSIYQPRVYFKIDNTFKRRLLSAWLERSNLNQPHFHTGELMNRLNSDIGTVTNGYMSIIPNILSLIIQLIVTTVLLYALLPNMAYGMLIGGIFMMMGTQLIRKHTKKLHKEANEAESFLQSYLQEVFQNPIIIRSFGIEQDVLSTTEDRLQHRQQVALKRNRFGIFNQLAISLIFNTAIITGTTVASFKIMNGQMAFGTYVAVAQLIAQMRGPLTNLTGFITRYFTMVASAERLQEVNPDYDQNFLSSDSTDALPTPELLTFEKVAFAYEDDDFVLSNFSLSIPKGQHLGIIGESGGGKSTFLKLLIGVYKANFGQINLHYPEHILNLTDEQFKAYRQLFAYVPQGKALLSGTIRDCVTFGHPVTENQDERIREALRLACALEFVETLPKGLDTEIKEAGAGLSEGQMQRITIARAIFTDRPYLVLDEATSALDAQTEKKLLENLKTLTDKTMILVTHRLEALSICSQTINFNHFRKPQEHP